MEKFIIEQKVKAGRRVKQFRELLGYNESDFAKLIKVTKNTITNIESGNGFNSNSISIITYFLGLKLDELFDFEKPLPDKEELKKVFLKRVKKENPTVLEKIASKRVTIKSIIEALAKESNYFNKPKSVSEVRTHLEKVLKKKINSPIVSQALSNAFNQKHLKRERSGLRNYKYYR